MARGWSPDLPSSPPATPNKNPAKGLTLRDLNRNILVDLGTAATADLLHKDPVAACNIKLDPGLYLLDRETPSGTHLVQTVVASAGWQTQVFLMERLQRQETDPVSPAVISILLGQRGFNPKDPKLRFDELARVALTDSRQVLSHNGIVQILDEKLDNPMLGILGAHLLLLKSDPGDLNVVFEHHLPIIIRNLRNAPRTRAPRRGSAGPEAE